MPPRIDPFELFAAYHLGLTEDGGYRFQNVHQVAKRFGTSSGAIKQALQDYGMSPDTVVNMTFDMTGAQVDVMFVPEGVSRREIAKGHYEAFCANKGKGKRDWQRELDEAARDNEKIFGPPLEKKQR